MDWDTTQLKYNLDLILFSYKHLDYGRRLNPVDAFFAFRLLLGRNPDLTHELPQILSDTRTYREFLADILNSDDFSQGIGFMPRNRVFMAKLADFCLWFNTGDREMGMVMASGHYEPHSVEAIKKILRPGMMCIDAGAHIGFYTCLMASIVGPTGRVYAF